MLASTGDHVPTGAGWSHEVKWDGVRVLADVRDGALTLTSRAENDVTAGYPELQALAGLYDDMLLDGEVVALEGCRPSFGGWVKTACCRTPTRPRSSSSTAPCSA